MHKIILLDLEYIGIEHQLKKKINVNNVLSYSKKKISFIGRNIDPVYFDIYKRNLFFEYFDLHKKPTQMFINTVNGLLKKLQIQLEYFEYKYVNEIIEEEFSLRRSKKSIEVSYKTPLHLKNKQPFFLEKEVKVFKKNNYGVYQYIDTYDVFFYDKVFILEYKNKVMFDIKSEELEYYKLTNLGVELKFNNNVILLKSSRNQILNNYFKRSL